MSGRPETVWEMLVLIAAYIDVTDRKLGTTGPGLTEVQDDLTCVARWLQEHPDVDREIHETLPNLDRMPP